MDSTSIHEISSPDPARERVISLAEVDEAQTSVPPPRKVVDIQDQSTRPKKILFVTVALCFSIFLSSFEQVAVSTTVPGIARDFGTSTAISWVGTSFLVATVSSQVIYSRLSDIFGRKILLIIAITVFSIGNLLCGFSRNLAELITFRVVAGLGGGGINVLVLIIISDICALNERGKYQAYVGVGVAAGGALGPLLGGVFTETVTWRWVFWITVPVSVLSVLQIIFFLPLKPVTGSFKSKLKKVDFLGCFTNLLSTIFILVPISSGGSTFPWSSPVVITLLVLGIIFLILFIIIEWKYAALPILPLHLIRHRSLGLLSLISFLSGIYYYTNAYFLPIYFQVVMAPPAGPILSSGLLQALFLPQIATAMMAGFAVQRLGHYNPFLWFGYGVYFIAAGVQTTFQRNTSHAYIVGILCTEGFGVGWTIQTALVAAQSLASPQDRAVVTGIRNFARFTGGSFGLAIASAIMNNVITSRIANAGFPQAIVDQIKGASFNIPLGLTSEQTQVLLDAEMQGVRGVFWFLLGAAGLTFFLSLPVEDKGLPGDEKNDSNEGAEAQEAQEPGLETVPNQEEKSEAIRTEKEE